MLVRAGLPKIPQDLCAATSGWLFFRPFSSDWGRYRCDIVRYRPIPESVVEQGKKSYLGWPDAFVIVAFGLLGVVLLAGWPPIPRFNWDAVAALGTIAAVVVALRVATHDARWREAERERRLLEEKFYLTSVSISATLVPGWFQELKHALSSWKEGDPQSFKSAEAAMSLLISALQEIDLNRVAWVSQPAATKIAASLYQLGLARLILSNWERVPAGHSFVKHLLGANIRTAENCFNEASAAMAKIVNAEVSRS